MFIHIKTTIGIHARVHGLGGRQARRLTTCIICDTGAQNPSPVVFGYN